MAATERELVPTALVGEITARRHGAVGSILRWALGWGVVAGAAILFTPSLPADLGARLSGALTLAMFAAAALYGLRKRNPRLSVHWLRLVARMPALLATRLDVLDRLETWRIVHVAVGMVALVPLWWHTRAHLGSPLEQALLYLSALLIVSGLAGTLIQRLMPHRMRTAPVYEVRQADIETAMHELYVEAEEAILGHSEALVKRYLGSIRPLLTDQQSAAGLLWATVRHVDSAPVLCAPARRAGAALEAAEGPIYERLVRLAERKLRLEQNAFDLRLSAGWVRFHLGLAVLVGVFILFHVFGVLYFAGL